MDEFIYIDGEKRWWFANGDLVKEGDIYLTEEVPEILKLTLNEKFIQLVNKGIPCIVYFEQDGSAKVKSPNNRKICKP